MIETPIEPEMPFETEIDVRLLTERFETGAEVDRFMAHHPGSGGFVVFAGQVRAGGGVQALELSHYGPLTLPGMRALAQEAAARWLLDGLLVVHRTGLLEPGEPIVLVAAAARHRRDAFLGADFVMDHLKSDAWFWKREKTDEGWRWIDPRPSDHQDLERWQEKAVQI